MVSISAKKFLSRRRHRFPEVGLMLAEAKKSPRATFVPETAMATTAPAPAKPEAKSDAAPAPRAGMVFNSTPTPTQHENDGLAAMQATGAPLPALPWYHVPDGSPVDAQSYSQTIGAPTWP
jgi:hypothetical protein